MHVVLGGYGSGKTMGAGLKLAIHALRHPHTRLYGDSNPESIVIGKTDKVIKDSSQKTLRQILPSALIRREWKSPGERAQLLANGHLLKYRTWSGSIEGLTGTAVWIDEAHLLEDSAAFTNYVARVRDPLCSDKLVIVSGIPEFGWLQDTFAEGKFPGSRVWHIATEQNTYLLPEDIARIRASCSERSAATYLKGQWSAPAELVYHEFDPNRHVVAERADPEQPTHLSIDIGSRSAVLWLQERPTYLTASGASAPGLRLHVVDEATPEQQSTELIMRDASRRPWRIVPGRSRIYVDPTARADELAAIERVFPGVSIVRKKKADEPHRVEYGVRCVNAALRDADGNTRLTFSRSLDRTGRGVLVSLGKFRRSETSGRVVKDNTSDHILDALRYPVSDMLPLQTQGVTTYPGGWPAPNAVRRPIQA